MTTDNSWSGLRDALIALVILTLWRGYILSVLWQWFIAPLGVPVIGLWHACGVSITAMILGRLSFSSKDTKILPMFLKTAFLYLLLWGMGALVHVMM